MKTFFAVIGAVNVALFLLGAINAIDYHVCIKGPGECKIVSVK